jgi:hypothetical protein
MFRFLQILPGDNKWSVESVHTGVACPNTLFSVAATLETFYLPATMPVAYFAFFGARPSK